MCMCIELSDAHNDDNAPLFAVVISLFLVLLLLVFYYAYQCCFVVTICRDILFIKYLCAKFKNRQTRYLHINVYSFQSQVVARRLLM